MTEVSWIAALRRVFRAVWYWRRSSDEERAQLMTVALHTLAVAKLIRVAEVGRDRDRQRNLPYLTRAYAFAVREKWLQLSACVVSAAITLLSGNWALGLLVSVVAYQIGEATAFIHCFSQSDPDQLHDHPWRWWFRIILTGGYFEETFDGRRWIAPGIGSCEFKLGSKFHRVIIPPGAIDEYRTWTFFMHGPRRQSWGFLYTDANGLVRRSDESKKRTSE